MHEQRDAIAANQAQSLVDKDLLTNSKSIIMGECTSLYMDKLLLERQLDSLQADTQAKTLSQQERAAQLEQQLAASLADTSLVAYQRDLLEEYNATLVRNRAVFETTIKGACEQELARMRDLVVDLKCDKLDLQQELDNLKK